MSHTKRHRYTGRELKARHLPVSTSLRLDDGTVILSRSLVPFRTPGRPKHPRYRHGVRPSSAAATSESLSAPESI